MAQPGAQLGGSLLPWSVTAEEDALPAGPHDESVATAAAATDAAPTLSVVDRVAAPGAFMHQCLVFEQPLDADRLRAALAQVLALVPTLACRATRDEDGEWQLCRPRAGARLVLGTSTAPLSRLAPLPPPAIAPLQDLGTELFGHLLWYLPPGGQASLETPLFQVALVTLQGGDRSDSGDSSSSGGCVLGLRLSHMIADFSTLRATLHHLAAAYSGRALAPGDAPVPAALLLAELAAVPPPAGSAPWNYLPAPPCMGPTVARLVAAPPLQPLTLHVTPERLAALKARVQGEVEAAAGGADDDGPAWISSNDALMAWLWKALAALPSRAGRGAFAFNAALDMRGRLPSQAAAQERRWIYGNLATSAWCPALDAAALPLGELALALRRTLVSDAAKFPVDVAHAAAAEAAGQRCSSMAILPVIRIVEAIAAGEPPALMASQLTLDHAADADFAGQLPVAGVPSFGRLLFDIANVQAAPPAAGGGVLLHLWLFAEESREMAAAVAAGGGP